MILAPIQTLVAEIGSMFGSGEERPATIMGTIGVQLATTKSRGLLNRSGFPLLLILFMALNGWATCQERWVSLVMENQCGVQTKLDGEYCSGESVTGTYCCQQNGSNVGTNYKVTLSGASPSCTWHLAALSSRQSGNCCTNGYSCNYPATVLRCTEKSEADSIKCVNEGKEWDSKAKECKICPNDTTWKESSCAYSPQRGQYLNVVNTFGIKDCESFSRSSQYYSANCDTAGHDTTLKCLGTFDGVHVVVQALSGATTTCAADGSCDFAIRKIAAGECNDPRKKPSPSSSASEPTSSSEGEPTSSSEGEPSSSDSGEGQHVIVDELPQELYDSLGHIDYNIELMQPFVSGIYDGVYEMLGNQYDMKENQRQGLDLLGDIRDATEGANTKLTTTNNLLNDIKNKNWSPNINVQPPQVNVENNTDVSGIQQRQDKTRDTLHHTNELLDSNKSLLHGILEWVSKGITMDSFKRTFDVDSSGWGRLSEEVSGAGDSLINQYGGIMAVNGCDTTGGRKCDNAIIGVGGLDSAKKSVKTVYGELRDSMTHGAFMDSLNNWGSAFTGNGVLIGSGSNNCPTFLARPHTITIGNSTTQMRLDGVLCATLFGNVTPWTLARVLIRSIVAFFCMVALFKAATGTMFTSEDE